MAVDPRIALQIRPVNAGQAFNNILSNIGNIDAIKQQRQEAPFQQQLLEQKAQQDAQNLELNRFKSVAQGALEILPDLKQDNPQAALQKLQSRRARLVQQQLPTQDTDLAIQQLQTPEGQLQLTRDAENIVNTAQQQGLLGQSRQGVQSSQFIPGVGFATLSKSGEAELVPVEGVGETTAEKRQLDLQKSARLEQQKSLLRGKTAAVKAAVTKGGQAFDRIAPLATAISNYDEAISAIDSGAETGVIDSMLPSFKNASIELDNVVKRLGLDVVGNTTFGALSESELAFALEAAIPTNLQPQELKQWLIAKRNAQRKVKERVEEAASFLSDGTHTIKDWIEFDKARQLNRQNQAQQTTIQQQDAQGTTTVQETTQQGNVIRFDAQGNIIQ